MVWVCKTLANRGIDSQVMDVTYEIFDDGVGW